MLKIIVLGVGLVLVILAGELRADAPAIGVRGDWLIGPVDGFTQTPRGGEVGTSSPNRPTLEEIGIDHASVFDAGLTLDWPRNRLYANAQFGQFTGSATIDRSLVSQGQTFNPGTRVDGEVDVNLYDIGYARRIDLPSRDFSLWLGGNVTLFDYNYELTGGGNRADRSYLKPTFQLGGDILWRPNGGDFYLHGGLFFTPPIDALPHVHEQWLLAGYDWTIGRASGSIFAGVKFQQVRFEDGQDVPNRTEIDYGPMFIVGLGVAF